MDVFAGFGMMPFSRAEALQAGMTKRQWELAIGSGQLVRLRRGVYVARLATEDRMKHAQAVAGALKNRTDHLAVAGSAVALLGLPNPYFTGWARVPVTIAGHKSDRANGILRNPGLAPVPTPWGPCSDLMDTAEAMAAQLPLPQALMVTDAAARILAGTEDRFVLASEECRVEARRRLTRTHDLPALQLADPAAESPAESFYRGHLLLRGIEEPACGVPMRGASGKQYFVDMLLDRLVIEVDGKEKYKDLEVLIAEKRREDDLRATGRDLLRSWVEDLYGDPEAEMKRLQDRREVIHRLVPTWG